MPGSYEKAVDAVLGRSEAPEQWIKPKRSLIVALSGVVGGMLAIMFVLIRNAVRKRKA